MRVFLKILLAFSLFIACSGEDLPLLDPGSGNGSNPNGSGNSGTNTETKTFAFDSNENSSLMFQNDESQDVFTSTNRKFEISKIIKITPIDNKTIEVANFAPVDLENVTITSTIEGFDEPIDLFKISKIRAHAKQEIKYPFVDGTTMFIDAKKENVDLSTLKDEGIDPAKITFDFKGDNDLIKKFKALDKVKWNIKLHDFDPDNNTSNNWAEDLTPKDARRFSGLMINLAAIFVSEDFKTEFINEYITDNSGNPLTKEAKETLYQKMLDKPLYNCGKVVNVSGLGGGSTFGVANWILNDYIKKETGFITAHEIGHTLGYNHTSNMTYPRKNPQDVDSGISPVTTRIMNKFLKNGSYPVTIDNYYFPTDFE